MSTRVAYEWAIIRHPSTEGAVICKLSNRPIIPDDVSEYGDFIIQSVPNSSDLSKYDIDRSELSDNEMKLINKVQFIE